jgi:hypothetical protein
VSLLSVAAGPSSCKCAYAQLLWKYSKSAVALRLRFLQQAEGVQARTALVQDVPGIQFGTLMHRADTTVLRVLPGIVKEPLKKTVSRVVDVGNKGLKATTGRITNNLTNRCGGCLLQEGTHLHLCMGRQDYIQ